MILLMTRQAKSHIRLEFILLCIIYFYNIMYLLFVNFVLLLYGGLHWPCIYI